MVSARLSEELESLEESVSIIIFSGLGRLSFFSGFEGETSREYTFLVEIIREYYLDFRVFSPIFSKYFFLEK